MAFTVPPVVGDVLRVTAPILAGALAGPLAPLAATIASGALDAWLGPKVRSADGSVVVPPAAIVQAVQQNSGDPGFLLAVRQAELDLEKYQASLGIRFADLEQKDRASAREMARYTGTAPTMFKWGMALVVISMLVMLAVIAGCIAAVAGLVRIDPNNAPIAIAAFTLIGTVVGNVNGFGMAVIQFFYGSSQSSKDKSDQISDTVRDLGQALGDAAKAGPVAPSQPNQPSVVVVPQPAPANETAADWDQSPFGGVRWRFDEDGYVMVEGEDKPGRTVGEPATVRRIWRDYGSLIQKHCSVHGVPMELVVACIATESRGQVNASLTEPDGRQSLGLMQVLTGTASEVMGREVSPQELLSPDIGIEAGVRYLAKQRSITGYSPPKAAAAYNAGGLYAPRPGDTNRWHLRSTGDHINRLVLYFNDCVFVAKTDGWSH